VIDTASLPPSERASVEGTLRRVLAAAREKERSPRSPLPDVGSSSITVAADDGTTKRLEFSEAEATADQAALMRALRPFLKVERWVSQESS